MWARGKGYGEEGRGGKHFGNACNIQVAIWLGMFLVENMEIREFE
jgi:hypothetical protein